MAYMTSFADFRTISINTVIFPDFWTTAIGPFENMGFRTTIIGFQAFLHIWTVVIGYPIVIIPLFDIWRVQIGFLRGTLALSRFQTTGMDFPTRTLTFLAERPQAI